MSASHAGPGSGVGQQAHHCIGAGFSKLAFADGRFPGGPAAAIPGAGAWP